ncbi:ArsR family transcriptional regulator [Acidovorax sp. Be4]|uniref:ArsR family transcriptional regulator n=1 Tax=Acidovorax bellezanensis TaxID=2976702 RepID=A0ABT2PHP4_9BURK|nr:helix-turn-helix transcriptional regulator [Acidovorax sp. Be4]MCT9809984.1 ArsR family transcriptional regulator [Acidovorax sp. Be4]
MNTNHIARIASLVGEPTRAAMLLQLMDGRMLTATELARAGNVSPQTGSRHLAQMVESGLMCVEQRGRHRYHRLASGEVAKVLEGIMQIAGQRPAPRMVVTGPRDETMRMARICYDHIAGRLGLAIAESLLADRAIVFDGEAGLVTDRAAEVLGRWGLPLEAAQQQPTRGRPCCRPCLDWSERKAHLAGRLGAMICTHCLDQGWLTRKTGSRALAISAVGATTFRNLLGLEVWHRVTDIA